MTQAEHWCAAASSLRKLEVGRHSERPINLARWTASIKAINLSSSQRVNSNSVWVVTLKPRPFQKLNLKSRAFVERLACETINIIMMRGVVYSRLSGGGPPRTAPESVVPNLRTGPDQLY